MYKYSLSSHTVVSQLCLRQMQFMRSQWAGQGSRGAVGRRRSARRAERGGGRRRRGGGGVRLGRLLRRRGGRPHVVQPRPRRVARRQRNPDDWVRFKTPAWRTSCIMRSFSWRTVNKAGARLNHGYDTSQARTELARGTFPTPSAKQLHLLLGAWVWSVTYVRP